MISLALNEICFFGEFSNIDKELLGTLDSGSMEKLERFESEYFRVEVNDVATPSSLSGFGGRKKEDESLIDLRSRRSKNSASLAQFSFEG